MLAEAVQRGELSFDDPVARYVTELAQGGAIRDVTLGELASHTSGLLLPTDHPPWPDHGYTLAEFIGVLNAWKPEPGHEPGRAHQYTHAGYVLLQLALERRFGLPIGTLITQRVLGPLGLNETVLPNHPLDGEHAALPGAVQGYGEDGEPIGVPGNQQSYYEFPGTGQMFSSARDFAILLAAFLGEAPVEPGLRAAMQQTQRGVFRISPHISQALAWEVVDFGGTTIVDKPGGIDNASAYVGLVPDKKLGVVILVNRGARNPSEIARNVILPWRWRGSAAHRIDGNASKKACPRARPEGRTRLAGGYRAAAALSAKARRAAAEATPGSGGVSAFCLCKLLWKTILSPMLRIETEREDDGRWLADVPALPGMS